MTYATAYAAGSRCLGSEAAENPEETDLRQNA
jgi:hypothetical protein